MNTTTRLTTVAVATVLAGGMAQAVAGPAQAIGGCASDSICLFTRPDFTGGVHTMYIPTLRSQGINNFRGPDDNSANGAINNSSVSVLLCQYHNLGGRCWVIPPNFAWEWTGVRLYWDRASSARIAG